MEQETVFQERSDIKALLAVGSKARSKQYHTLLSRIAKGEVLNVTEQKVLGILEEELKVQTSSQDTLLKNSLPNLLAVADYLDKRGWKVSKSAIYNHAKQKKIKPRENGAYYIGDVEKYASLHLSRKDQSGTSPDKSQQDKSSAEARKALAQAIHWEVRTKIIQNQYVPREAFEQELAARAALFNADLDEFFYSQAPAVVHLVAGDQNKIPDLIDFMITAKESWIARYAEHRDFNIDPSSYEKLLQDESPAVQGDDE